LLFKKTDLDFTWQGQTTLELYFTTLSLNYSRRARMQWYIPISTQTTGTQYKVLLKEIWLMAFTSMETKKSVFVRLMSKFPHS